MPDYEKILVYSESGFRVVKEWNFNFLWKMSGIFNRAGIYVVTILLLTQNNYFK